MALMATRSSPAGTSITGLRSSWRAPAPTRTSWLTVCAISRTKGLLYLEGCVLAFLLCYGFQLVKFSFGNLFGYLILYVFSPLGEEAVCYPIGSYMPESAVSSGCSGACVGTPHLCHQHPQPSPGAVSSHREPHAGVRSVLWMLGRLCGHSSPTTTHQPSLVCGWGATSE